MISNLISEIDKNSKLNPKVEIDNLSISIEFKIFVRIQLYWPGQVLGAAAERPTRPDRNRDRLPIPEAVVEDSSSPSTAALQAQVRWATVWPHKGNHVPQPS